MRNGTCSWLLLQPFIEGVTNYGIFQERMEVSEHVTERNSLMLCGTFMSHVTRLLDNLLKKQAMMQTYSFFPCTECDQTLTELTFCPRFCIVFWITNQNIAKGQIRAIPAV